MPLWAGHRRYAAGLSPTWPLCRPAPRYRCDPSRQGPRRVPHPLPNQTLQASSCHTPLVSRIGRRAFVPAFDDPSVGSEPYTLAQNDGGRNDYAQPLASDRCGILVTSARSQRRAVAHITGIMRGSPPPPNYWLLLVGDSRKSISGSQAPPGETTHKSVTVRFHNTFRGRGVS